MRKVYPFFLILFYATISFAQESYTEDFEDGDRNVLAAKCWTFSSTSVRTNDAIDSYSVRTGQLTNTINPHRVGTPCTFFDGSGSITFDHKVTSLGGSSLKRLDLVAISKEEAGVTDTLLTYTYSSTSSRTETIPVNLLGNYTVEWRWIGIGGTGRGILDNVEINGQNIADPGNGCTCQSNTFPVEWADISISQSKSGMIISWSTSQEVNNWMFEIERATDGPEFILVDQVQAVGNSQRLTSYSFTDKGIDLTKGQTLAYRVKQIDLDGQFSFSPVIETQIQENRFSLEAFPNPARDELNLRWGNDRNANDIKVIDASGRLITKISLNDQTSQTLNTKDWKRGMYFLLLNTSQGTETTKIRVE